MDDYAVKWTFAQPNTAFLLDLANKDGADKSITNLAFAPAHYLKDFHPNYTDAAALDAVVKERGFETWTELFAVEALPHLRGSGPSTAAWVPDNSSVSDPVFTLKRNPYYFAVDQDGNQLPYIDEARFTFFADAEALNLAAIGGEIDMQGRHIKMSNYPVLVENDDKGGYDVLTWPTFGGSDAVLMFNQTYNAQTRRCRACCRTRTSASLCHTPSIARRSRNWPSWALVEARQGVPAPFHPYYPGDEWAFKYTELTSDNGQPDARRHRPDRARRRGFPHPARRQPAGHRDQVIAAFANWPDIAQVVVAELGRCGCARPRRDARASPGLPDA